MRPGPERALALLLALASPAGPDERAGRSLPVPTGPEPAPVAIPHFPRRVDAFVFRNWGVAPLERIARAVEADPDSVRALARDLGLGDAPPVSDESWRRSAITAIRRNWHLLPRRQLLDLLGWSEGELGYALREDDFLWVKLGSLKPRCEALRLEPAGPEDSARHARIRGVIEPILAREPLTSMEPRFSFIADLSSLAEESRRGGAGPSSGEADLSRGWSLVLPDPAPDDVSGAAGAFRERLRTEFQVDLPIAKRGAEPSIEVILVPGLPGPVETHEIEVTERKVLARARDTAGIRRGLDRLIERMEESGGPYLAKGSERREPAFQVRFLYSYFALYGDALLEPFDPYPEGYLERLSRRGVNGVWLPVLLRNMAGDELGLSPTDPGAIAERERRIARLRDLVERARRHGIGVYLYLNEPRAMPLEYFRGRPDLKGVVEGDSGSLCTSVPAVREWISASLASIFERVPGLAGVFTITASENLTSCHSHHRGSECARCRGRPGPHVIAEVNRAVADGVRRSSTGARVICWDWGWPDDWIEPILAALPRGITVMSVSEWSLPLARGGVPVHVGEYSISAVGPGPRARRTWEAARKLGLATAAKVQVGNTWELAAVPYIPVPALVAEHAGNLREAGVEVLLLSWTLGGYPSPNLDVAASRFFGRAGEPPWPKDAALHSAALRRFGPFAGKVEAAWRGMSEAFREYPFDAEVIYRSPVQFGPANLLHAEGTGYSATMIGFPYDDIDGWRGPYPAAVLEAQFARVAAGWEDALRLLDEPPAHVTGAHRTAYEAERRVAEAALLHWKSVAHQCRFVIARRRHREAMAGKDRAAALSALDAMERAARGEEEGARRLLALAARDSRLGFEASNAYFYVPVDLLEKVINTRWIVEEWIPARREEARRG